MTRWVDEFAVCTPAGGELGPCFRRDDIRWGGWDGGPASARSRCGGFKEQGERKPPAACAPVSWQAGPARLRPTRVVRKYERPSPRRSHRGSMSGRREGAYGVGAPRAPLQERSPASSVGCPRLRPATERLPWLPMFQPAVRTRPRPCWNDTQYRMGFGCGDKWGKQPCPIHGVVPESKLKVSSVRDVQGADEAPCRWRVVRMGPGLRRDDAVGVGRSAETAGLPADADAPSGAVGDHAAWVSTSDGRCLRASSTSMPTIRPSSS